MRSTASDSASTFRYPAASADRDRFILERRPPRPKHDPWRHQGVQIDQEPDEHGQPVRAATVFLTGRECPWRCVMCDLWRYTITGDTPAGAITRQIADALDAMRAGEDGAPSHLKLYNAGSFFDPRAVSPEDDEAIASLLGSHRQIIVESHPALVGDRAWRFQEALRAHAVVRSTPPSLQVAMGLETAHPQALEQLHKHVTVERFASAAAALAAHGVSLRVFVLIHPPFIPLDQQDEWLDRSLELAFTCGASVISLIPTRTGNGAMEALEDAGLFVGPRLSDVERSLALAFHTKGPGAGAARRVLVDLWDLDRFIDCAHCAAARRDRLQRMNLTQQTQPPVTCMHCTGSAA